MRIAEVEECRGADFVGIAGDVRMNRSVAPEEIQVAGRHRESHKSVGVARCEISQDALRERIVQQELVDDIRDISRPDRPNVPEQDQFTRLLARRHFDREQRGHEITIEVKPHGMLQAGFSGQTSKNQMILIVLDRP